MGLTIVLLIGVYYAISKFVENASGVAAYRRQKKEWLSEDRAYLKAQRR